MYRILHIPTGTLLTRSGKEVLSFYSRKEAAKFLLRFFKVLGAYNEYVAIRPARIFNMLSRSIKRYNRCLNILDPGMSQTLDPGMSHRNAVNLYTHIMPLYLVITDNLVFFTSPLLIDKCEFLIIDETYDHSL